MNMKPIFIMKSMENILIDHEKLKGPSDHTYQKIIFHFIFFHTIKEKVL